MEYVVITQSQTGEIMLIWLDKCRYKVEIRIMSNLVEMQLFTSDTGKNTRTAFIGIK